MDDPPASDKLNLSLRLGRNIPKEYKSSPSSIMSISDAPTIYQP